MTLTVEQRDQVFGWGGAVLLHAIVAIILALTYLKPAPIMPAVVSVDFVTLTPPPPSPTIAASKPAKPAVAVKTKARSAATVKGKSKSDAAVKATKGKSVPAERTSRVKLPERSSVTRDQVLSTPKAKKLDAPEGGGGGTRHTGSTGTSTKSVKPGTAKGTTDGRVAPGGKSGTGVAAGKGTPGIADRDAGSSALSSVQWIGGGRRRKISGSLPSYPEGTNVEAQIRIEAIVTPKGTVKSVHPAQKGNARLEEAAMHELRQWRFEPLSRNLPQKDQRCIVTFNFTLR